MDIIYFVGFLMDDVVCKMKYVVFKGIFEKFKEQYIGKCYYC